MLENKRGVIPLISNELRRLTSKPHGPRAFDTLGESLAGIFRSCAAMF